MSQKETQKKRDITIEEEKDFYLSFVNKKLRNARKKLEQIDELLKRDKKTLKAEQLEKINSRADVLQNIQHTEELKDIYYAAYKTGIEEGKVQLPERSIDKSETSDKDNGPSKAGKPAENVPTVLENDTQSKEEIVRETLRKVLNLISFSQVFGNISAREEFSKTCEQKNEQINKEEIPRVDELQQLYKSAFNFTENSESTSVEDRINKSLDKLTQFVKAEDQTVFGDKTYKNLQEIVDKTTNTASFKQSILNIENLQKTVVQQVTEEQPKAEEKAKVQEEVPESNNKEQAFEEVEEVSELPPGATCLKPDLGDSPRKGSFLPVEPKLVRFVDEIEREIQTAQKAENLVSPQNKNEEGDSTLKEVAIEQDVKVSDEGKEGEQPEQKSFRTKKYNNQYGQNKGKHQNNNKGYDNRNNTQRKPNASYKENKYGNGNQRGYGKVSYGVQYVEKKSQQQNED